MALPNNVFTGYSPTQLRKLAQSYGYNETNLDNFGKFLEENPSRAKQYFDQQNMDMFGFAIPFYYYADKKKKTSYCGATITLLIWIMASFYIRYAFIEA